MKRWFLRGVYACVHMHAYLGVKNEASTLDSGRSVFRS